jgi:hypothetical protein
MTSIYAPFAKALRARMGNEYNWRPDRRHQPEYVEGWDAADAGGSKSSNPYDEDSGEHMTWNAGYDSWTFHEDKGEEWKSQRD